MKKELQEAVRILQHNNQSIFVLTINENEAGDILTDEVFLRANEFRASLACAQIVHYMLKMNGNQRTLEQILEGIKSVIDVTLTIKDNQTDA